MTRASDLFMHQAYLISIALVEEVCETTQHVSEAWHGSTCGQCILQALVTGK